MIREKRFCERSRRIFIKCPFVYKHKIAVRATARRADPVRTARVEAEDEGV